MSEPSYDPYAPPRAPLERDAPSSAADAPTAIPATCGVLSIVFGAAVSLSGVLLLGFASLGLVAGTPNERPFCVGIALLGLILTSMSVALIVIGVGQRRLRAWAGRFTRYWGLAALLVVVGIIVLSFALLGPASERMEWTPGATPGHASGGDGTDFAWGIAGPTCFFLLPYPIVLLALFTRPRVIAAMKS